MGQRTRAMTEEAQDDSPSMSEMTIHADLHTLTPQSQHQERPHRREPSTFLQAVESNSGAAFARLLINSLDPGQSVSPMRMIAWNLYLGERQPRTTVQLKPLKDILTLAQMQDAATTYLTKVQPCYGFLNEDMLPTMVSDYWHHSSTSEQEAVLCGIAALGSLFSDWQDLTAEAELSMRAKHLLDPAFADPPSFLGSTAWLLRAVYLRLTAKPEEAWLASCSTLHLVDAARITDMIKAANEPGTPQQLKTAHAAMRVLVVAQHLNTWMSYDLGRCRVVLQEASIVVPPKAAEYTFELMGLLPLSRYLDPANGLNGQDLVTALSQVLSGNHTRPPSVLAQCNLLLCIYRRLHASRVEIPDNIMVDVLEVIKRSLQAAQSCVSLGLPWHHVSNIPFQAVCTLMAIDTAHSLALLNDALACVTAVHEAYHTEATQEAVTVAFSLLHLHRLRREAEIRRHSDMLKFYPSAQPPTQANWNDDLINGQDVLDSWWVNEFGPLDSSQFLQAAV